MVEPTTITPETPEAGETEQPQEEDTKMEEPSLKEEKAVEEAPQEETKTQAINEPEAEDQPEQPLQSKYMLLERLFSFLSTEQKPINDVLAGYFSKLLTLLINRKQKSLIPFLFNPENDALDRLLEHVYQKSISELLIKVLNLQEPLLGEALVEKQHQIVETLIEKLGPQYTEEDNLNASSVLSDVIDAKDYYSVITKQVQKLIDFAIPAEGSQTTQES